MTYRNNQKGVLDARQVEFIITDPLTGLLDSKSSTVMSKSGVGSLPTQPDITTLNSTYPAPSYPGDSVQIGTSAPYSLYISNGVSWLPVSSYLDPITPGAFENMLDAISSGTSDTTIFLLPGATYTLTRNPTVDVYKTSIIGCDNLIDASAITIGLTFDYKSAYTSGPELRKTKSRKFEGFRLKGPGQTANGTVGIWISSSTTNAPSPSIKNIVVYDFETLIGGRDRFYLTDLDGCIFYHGTYGIWQQAGVDSGEGCMISGGVFDQCYCFVRVDDPSSEWSFDSVSFDYGRQLLVAVNSSNIQFNTCHIECRGKNLASDNNNYILNGSGSDARAAFQSLTTTTNSATFVVVPASTQTGAMTLNVGGSGAIALKKSDGTTDMGSGDWVSGVPVQLIRDTTNNCYKLTNRTMGNIPCVSNMSTGTAITCDAIITRDCFFDVDGETVVRFNNGNFNVNDSGGVGPYAYYRLAKVRNIGTIIDFNRVYRGNDANVVDHFWDGPGRVFCNFISKIGGNPQNILIQNHLSRNNVASNYDLTYSTIDTSNGSTITNNVTASNLASHQNWWIYMGRAGNPPTNRFSDSSNGAYGTVAFTATISTTSMTVSAVASGVLYPGMTITGSGVTVGTKIVSQSSGTVGSTGVYVIDISQTISTGTAMTASYPTGNVGISVVQPSVGNATSTSWSISGEVITINATVTSVFIRDMVLSGTGVTTGTRIIGQLTGTTGGVGTYLIDTVHGTVTGTGNLTGTIGNAIQINKYNAETSGYLSRARVAFAVPISPQRVAVSKFLTLIPTTGGIGGGEITFTSQYARLAPQLDSNGCPVIVETFSQIRFKTFTISSTTKDQWQETILDAWSGIAEAPPGATHYMVQVSFDGNGTPGVFYVARPRVDLR